MNKFKPSKPLRLHRDDPNFVSKDSELIDRLVREHIDIGGVVVYAYRYLGTPIQNVDALHISTDPGIALPINVSSFMGIQDGIYMENRDRAYDLDNVPRLRGVFKVSQNDMIYGRFGSQGMNNDVFSIEFHTRTVEASFGRRFIMGDVLEFPHLKDVSVNFEDPDGNKGGKIVPKLYEVARVMRSPTGWDQHYNNHILALILRPVREQQEFTQFMERMDQYGNTLASQASTGSSVVELNDAMAEKAEELAPSGPWDTTAIYFDPNDLTRRPNWWIDNGQPPNGMKVDSGSSFPPFPNEFDWFLKNHFVPNRLYQFYNGHWNIRQIDNHLTWQNYGWIAKYQDFLQRTDDTET